MVGPIVALVGLVLVLAALYVEVYFYEGVHLGPRIQGKLYDQWAARYDGDKQESQRHDAELLVAPLLAALDQVGAVEPLVLDVATGTGRLPAALLSESAFGGQVIALDISQGMLVHAAEKLAPHGERAVLVRHGAASLPFLDGCFDVLSCLEALEIMSDVHEPLAEFARVVRPGGFLLTSRAREVSGRWGKVRSADRLESLLREAGFEQVEIQPWWKLFDRVWARKPGTWTAGGARTWADVLCCPACGAAALEAPSHGALRCQQCGGELPVSPEGIVLG